MSASVASKRFVIYADQRSGSTWLHQMLDSHPQVRVKGELFLHRTNAHVRKLISERRDDPVYWAAHWAAMKPRWRRLLRPRYVFAHLDRVFEAMENDAAALGFKLMYDQSCLYPESLGYLVRRKVPVVHLVRENHLDVILSRESRRLRGVAHAARTVEQVQVHLDPATLLKRLRHRERVVSRAAWLIRALRLPHVRLTYESAMNDPAQLTRVLEWLNVDADVGLLHSRNQKLNTAPHWRLIANYDAVRRTLEPTRFAALLQTPPA